MTTNKIVSNPNWGLPEFPFSQDSLCSLGWQYWRHLSTPSFYYRRYFNCYKDYNSLGFDRWHSISVSCINCRDHENLEKTFPYFLHICLYKTHSRGISWYEINIRIILYYKGIFIKNYNIVLFFQRTFVFKYSKYSPKYENERNETKRTKYSSDSPIQIIK